jgi:hypothetical protein
MAMMMAVNAGAGNDGRRKSACLTATDEAALSRLPHYSRLRSVVDGNGNDNIDVAEPMAPMTMMAGEVCLSSPGYCTGEAALRN